MKIYSASTSKNRIGLTLIDLTVTILIMGILAGIAAPRFADSMSYFAVESAAKRLANDLRMSRSYAIDKSQEQRMSINQRANSYQITTLTDPDKPGQRYEVELDEHPYDSVFAKLSFQSSNDIIFDIYGRINFSGTIILTSGSTSKTVEFDAESGEVTVQ